MSTVADQNPAASAFEVIGQELVVAINELFAEYDGVVHEDTVAPVLEGQLALASIGFTAEGMAGSLSIVTPLPVVRTLQKLFMDEEDDSALESTIGEYSNMLLGRLKNRVLEKGIVFAMATPMCSISADVRLIQPVAKTRRRWYVFESKARDMKIGVCVDVAFDPNFDFRFEDGVKPIEEGSILMFDMSERKAA